MREQVEDVSRQNGRLLGEAQCVEVLPEDLKRPEPDLDEYHVAGAAAEGLETQAAGPGEQVEDGRVADFLAEDIEKGAPHPLGRGADLFSGRTRDPASLRAPGDDSHLAVRSHSE